MEHWTKIEIGPNLYIVKFEKKSDENHESFTLWMSDFKTLWTETIDTKNELFQRLVDENVSMTIDDEIADKLIKVLGTFANYHQTSADVKPNDEAIKFHCKLVVDGGIFTKFYWLLKKCEAQVFFEQVTKSLLHQIGALEERNKQLIDIAMNKDIEIKQYGLEGAPPLSRKKFITAPFDEAAFTSQPRMFNCDVGQFEAVIGSLTKSIEASDSKPEISPIKTSPKVQRGRGTGRNRDQPYVRKGEVLYGSDEDEEQSNEQIKTEVNSVTEGDATEQVSMEVVAPTPKPKKPSPPKRIRRDFNF